jgi:hypothetical protein
MTVIIYVVMNEDLGIADVPDLVVRTFISTVTFNGIFYVCDQMTRNSFPKGSVARMNGDCQYCICTK